MQSCLLEVYNSKTKKSDWIAGEIIGLAPSDAGENFNRIDVKTANGIYYGCHPDCVKEVK